ncbi:MAG: hypothetical protein NT009_08975 [Proteobacteria bacterium]|nr:hypothetical protein [Pseudomonadota bacterium]
MKNVLISFFLALCMVFSWSNSSKGEEAVNANEILGPGTFYMSTPTISYGIQDIEDGPQFSNFSFEPSFGFFLAKYIRLGIGISMDYDKTEYQGESSSSTTYFIRGSLGADFPVTQRLFFDINTGFGYFGISTDGADDYNGPAIHCGAGIMYFINRYIAIGPGFGFTHVFEDQSMSVYGVGLDLSLFFPGKK